MNTEHFVTDVLDLLTSHYTTLEGAPVQGQSVSYLLTQMRGGRIGAHTKSGRRWRGFQSLSSFQYLCEQNGFKSVIAKNERGQRATVITL
jgi:hypothetical protein